MIKRNVELVICLCALIGWTWSNVWGAEYIVSADKGKMQLQLSQDGAIEEMKLAGEQVPLSGKRGGFFLIDKKAVKEINLIPNPGFEEDADQNDIADNWTYAGEWKRVREKYRASGDWIMQCKVSGSEPVFTKRLILIKDIPVKPAARYKFSYWEKLDEVYGKNKGRSSFSLYIVEKDKTGKGLQQKSIYRIIKGTRKWTKLEKFITTYNNTVTLSLYANMYPGTGTGYIDDISLVEQRTTIESSKKPVKGDITSKNNLIIQKENFKSLGLKFEAVYHPGENYIQVDGKIKDTTGKDRAIDVIFSLPVNLNGWIWWDDIDNVRKVKGTGLYQDTAGIVCGDGLISLLPFSAISNNENGISYGLPLSQGPKVYRIYYSAEQGYVIHFYLGLSKEATKTPQKATFSFIIYQHDGKWGIRSAAKKFYQFYPEPFKKRTMMEGVLGYGGKWQQMQKDWKNPEDFGKGWEYLGHHHSGYTGYRLSCKRREDLNPKNKLRYLDSLCDAYISKKFQSQFKKWCRMPVVVDGEERIAGFADDPPTFIRDSYLTAQDGKTAIDDTGALSTFRESDWMYPKGTSCWYISFRNFNHPEIKGSYKVKLTKQWLSKAKGTGNETITTDGTGMVGKMAHTSFRSEHFKYTSYPLSYGVKNKNLCIPDTNYDWNIYIRNGADKKNICIMNNISWSIGNPSFDVPYIDIGGLEGNYKAGTTERMARCYRTLMYQKLLRYFWNPGDEKNREKNLENKIMEGLHYGVFMGPILDLRILYKKYIPIIEKTSKAGWEPITYAKAADPEVHIERWGYWSKDNLYFSIRNNTFKIKNTIITVDTKDLEISIPSKETILRELTNKTDIPFKSSKKDIVFEMTLNPNQTKVVQLISQEGILNNLMLEASDILKKLTEEGGYVDSKLKSSLQELKEDFGLISAKKIKNKIQTASEISLVIDKLYGVYLTNKNTAPGTIVYKLFQAGEILSRFVEQVHYLTVNVNLSEQVVSGDNVPVKISLTNDSNKKLKQLKSKTGSAKKWNIKVISSIPDKINSKDIVSCLSVINVPKTIKIGDTNTIFIKITAKDDKGKNICIVKSKELVAVEPFKTKLLTNRFNNINIFQTISLEIENKAISNILLNINVMPPRKWLIDKKETAIKIKGKSKKTVNFKVTIPKDYTLSTSEISFLLSWEKDGGKVAKRTFDKVFLVSGVICRKIKKNLTLDGKLTEKEWEKANVLDKFVLLKTGKIPTQKTEAKLLYTNKALYIGVICYENKMKEIIATKTVRDSAVYADDDIEIFLGIPELNLPYYQIAINTLGTIYDSKLSDKNWNGKLKVAVYKAKTYWSLEMAIPFIEPNVNQAPCSRDIWRINIGRSERPHRETSSLVKEGYKVAEKYLDLIFE